MSETTDDRRRFQRIATDKQVRLRHGHTEHSGIALDISLRGLLLETDGNWQPAAGTRVQASVLLDDQVHSISMDGEIAHVTGRRIGLHCVGIDLESASLLRRMVELNLDDPGLLERDLEQLTAG